MMKIIFVFLCLSSPSHASYSNFAKRYVSGPDLVQLLLKNFPGYQSYKNEKLSVKCYSIESANKDALGMLNPGTGHPAITRPNPGMIRWLNECLTEYLKFEFNPLEPLRPRFIQDHFSKNLIEKFRLRDLDSVQKFLAKKWSELGDSEQKSLAEQAVKRLIGPASVINSNFSDRNFDDVVADHLQILKQLMPPEISVSQALQQLNRSLVISDEFLRY